MVDTIPYSTLRWASHRFAPPKPSGLISSIVRSRLHTPFASQRLVCFPMPPRSKNTRPLQTSPKGQLEVMTSVYFCPPSPDSVRGFHRADTACNPTHWIHDASSAKGIRQSSRAQTRKENLQRGLMYVFCLLGKFAMRGRLEVPLVSLST